MDRTRGRSPLEEIGASLHQKWALELDRAASAKFAHQACALVLADFDPLRDHSAVVAAAQFLWETEGDLLNADTLVRRWRRRVHEITRDWDAQDALEPRFRALILHGRLAFHANEYGRARRWNDAAIRQLRLSVGGDGALRATIKESEPTLAGRLYSAFLPIQLPVIRMDRRNWLTSRQLHDIYLRDAISIIERYPPYDRLPDLVTQTFFALAARGDPDDAKTVDWLSKLDRLVRPKTPRAQCTRWLVDMVLAKFQGDLEGELEAALMAEQELRAAGLLRHIRALNSRGWWKLRPATLRSVER